MSDRNIVRKQQNLYREIVSQRPSRRLATSKHLVVERPFRVSPCLFDIVAVSASCSLLTPLCEILDMMIGAIQSLALLRMSFQVVDHDSEDQCYGDQK
jgi:hypothetical protein